MTKQRIVIKLYNDCDKCRSKAMGLAASAGADSVSIEGENRDQLVVVGDSIDAADLTSVLRKKVCHAELIIVKETVETVEKRQREPEQPISYPIQWYSDHPVSSRVVVCEEAYASSNPNSCSIM